MFEEEVEERFIKSYPQFCCNEKPLSPFWDIWEAGAEFGYNKANEKAKEIIREFMRISTVCDEDFEPDYSVLIDKAEEFLREEEGKNDKDRP